MDAERQAALWFLLRRLVPAAAALAIGVGILLGAGASIGLLLLGFLCFLVAAIFLAGPLAQLLAEPVGELLWPKRYYDKPQPLYGIPQASAARACPRRPSPNTRKSLPRIPTNCSRGSKCSTSP